MDKQTLEQEIKNKGLNAPRITPEHIESVVARQQFFIVPETTLTICVLTLKNGYTVTGESACASPANFNEELGRHIARDNALNKIWPLEGYLLRDRLYNNGSV